MNGYEKRNAKGGHMQRPLQLAEGSKVRITYQAENTIGTVLFQSDNGKSLMLGFESVLGGYVGSMPILWVDRLTLSDDEHETTGQGYVDLLRGFHVELEAMDQ